MTISYKEKQSILKSNLKWICNKKSVKKPARKRKYLYHGIPKASFSDLAKILGEHEN